MYINGQEEEHHYDKHDYMFCGKKLTNLEQDVNISQRIMTNYIDLFLIVVLAESKAIKSTENNAIISL